MKHLQAVQLMVQKVQSQPDPVGAALCAYNSETAVPSKLVSNREGEGALHDV